jgi:superfamily I DNA and RNA helicase
MVYVLDCQHCVTGHELITLRNILFTAITRCRAWVRLCGWGPEMELLETEIRAVRDRKFRLQFTVPTAVELAKLRQIHRERTADERARIEKAEKSLKDFLDAVHQGDLAIENLPLELRTDLAKYLASAAGLDDDAE